jgi:hypothetical protein
MPEYPIKLGKKMGGPEVASMPMHDMKDEPFYPTLHLDWDSKYDLPDSGTMTVRFRKCRRQLKSNAESDNPSASISWKSSIRRRQEFQEGELVKTLSTG